MGLKAEILKEVAYWSDETASTHAERDRAIVHAYRKSIPVREIAEAASLSPQGVRKILAKPLTTKLSESKVEA